MGVGSGYSGERWNFALSPDGKHLVTLLDSTWPQPDCVMYQLNKWRCKPLKFPSPKGYLYLAADPAHAVPLQDLDNRNEFFQHAQFSPDNQYVAAISIAFSIPSSGPLVANGDQVRIWHVADGKLFQHLAFPDNLWGSVGISFSPDSRQLAVMVDGGSSISLLEFQNQETLWTIKEISVQFNSRPMVLCWHRARKTARSSFGGLATGNCWRL